LALLVGVSDANSLFIWPIGGCTCLKAAFFPAETFSSFKRCSNAEGRSVVELGSGAMIAPFFVFFDMF
jgi:hypothetical protein